MKLLSLVAASALASSVATAQEWPRFRGPNGSGVSSASLPASFGPEENVRWKADVPFGSSSPVLTESAVVVTAADEASLFVMAIDRSTGEELWTNAIERDRTMEVFKSSDSASPSPVTDGTNVYAFFPEMGLVSYDANGDERWRHPLGEFISFYGMSSSPVLAGDTLLLLCDQQVESFLLAVDAKTGEQRWRKKRDGIIECWTTPVVYPADAPEQLLCFGSYFLTSYSIANGEELWRMPGFGYTPVCSPILDGDRLYVSVPDHAENGAFPDWGFASAQDANEDGKLVPEELSPDMREHFGWVDTNKDNAIVEAEWNAAAAGMGSKDFGLAAIDLSGEDGPVEVWRYKKSLPSIATPLLHDGILYLVRDGGLVTLVDAESGEVMRRERLPEGMGENWPSPIAAGDKVFVANNDGKVAVIAAGPEWSVLATNDLGEACLATPAIGRDALFVRTREAVWAFGATEQ